MAAKWSDTSYFTNAVPGDITAATSYVMGVGATPTGNFRMSFANLATWLATVGFSALTLTAAGISAPASTALALGANALNKWNVNSVASGTSEFASASGTARWIGGVTANAIRNSANTTDNLSWTDAGAFTFRSSILAGSSIVAGAANLLGWSTRTAMSAPSDGVLRLTNSGQSDFDRLQFGGTTASFPSLKRSTTALQCRLADDSNYAPFAASGYSAGATAGVTAGPFTAITSIQVIGGLVTTLTGT